MRWIPTNGHVRHELSESDLGLLRSTPLCHGAAELDDILDSHTMCVMQLTSMLVSAPKQRLSHDTVEQVDDGYDVVIVNRVTGDETTAYTDNPPCVSEAITEFMIELNDGSNDEERQMLVDVVPEIIDTCPVVLETRHARRGFTYEVEQRDRTSEYRAAEQGRRNILGRARDERSIEEKLDAVRRAAAVGR